VKALVASSRSSIASQAAPKPGLSVPVSSLWLSRGVQEGGRRGDQEVASRIG
jgi:hypothetical protein